MIRFNDYIINKSLITYIDYSLESLLLYINFLGIGDSYMTLYYDSESELLNDFDYLYNLLNKED